MVKHVIFDFDGTLVDSKMTFISSWNTLAKKHRFKEVNPEDLENLNKLSMKERSKLYNFPMYKLPFVIPEIYKLFKESIHEIKLFDGIKELLHELERTGYQTTIISSNSQDNIEAYLERNQIKSVSNVICSSSLFGKDKLINKFLKDNNLQASEVIYVGDEHRDIVACKKSGVKIIWVGWGFDSFEVVQAEQPDFMVYEPSEILKVI
ncbi:HAD hydrolase-like protein [Radiobacillus sp. PE A8.2]|uniref:HAD hydrolase-like protein n=1 Tax=Radiobacillus sp. PE A8.2 TaxID=3380349 RepID=UPI00388E5C84